MTTEGKEPIKHISIQDFSDQGYMAMVNRIALHPLGLALERSTGFTYEQVKKLVNEILGAGDSEDACEAIWEFVKYMKMDQTFLSGVWDYRDDPEGMTYGPGMIDYNKEMRIEREWTLKEDARKALLGGNIQGSNPVDGWYPAYHYYKDKISNPDKPT